ncbi:flagellar type III secretion system pore protein FliP [Tautonia plasticadhaerens]|uniref:Flagellar biosynthetic protein FliP n=1 Tax=Tautonia plasticadhaerens TaxID=2527974 RepID=A0A518HDC6_9BACT|nr:flagellar type III secretion system pore protein FliP [Tautonia plasticadhaerens]QDV38686.1 Flagellar biosynthetic protein FliP precursor [Tautonia plasticadhaerens]
MRRSTPGPQDRPADRRRPAVNFIIGPGVLLLGLLAGPLALGGEGGGVPPSPAGPSLMGVDPAMFDRWSIELDEAVAPASAVQSAGAGEAVVAPPARDELERVARTVGLFAAVSLAPVAVLMATAFVRINVVLLLLRQAIGSPQVPGNQVLMALSLLLTAMVMAPAAESVYRDAIAPYADGELSAEEAWRAGSGPIKAFMLDQIRRTGHDRYLEALEARAAEVGGGSGGAGGAGSASSSPPLRVVAPAFLISELTTALWIGFVIYLPFLVIDLVASAVLAATGLIMLPPAQVALPLKLAVFVLADGWWLVADALLRTFAVGSPGGG